eukprot:SAG11_NODE_9439_length_911_cov_1.210591_1_plen_101_part_01
MGRVTHNRDEDERQDGRQGGLPGTGIDLSGYFGGDQEAIFTSPAFEMGGFAVPEIRFTVPVLLMLALVYALAEWRGLLAVGFLYLLTLVSDRRRNGAPSAA